MSRKGMGVVLLVVGIAILVGAAAADPLGIGGAAGFGWKQMVGVSAGVLVAAVGLARWRSTAG